MNEEHLFEEISTAVVDMEDESVEKLCKESLTFSIPAEKRLQEVYYRE